jgi:hypothetical protein
MKRDGMNFRHNPRYRGEWSDAHGGVVFFSRATGGMVPMSGRSLTNMIYSEDGRAFLMEDGAVFTQIRRRASRT